MKIRWVLLYFIGKICTLHISFQSMHFYTGNPSISTTFQTAFKSQRSLNILSRFQSSVYVNLYTVYDTVRQCGGNVLTETKEGKLGLMVPPLELWRPLGLSVGIRETRRKIH